MTDQNERSYLELGLQQAESPLWVIPRDLCTRCGACHVICPTNVVRFEDEYPFIQTGGCIDCGLCLDVCPGIEFNLQEMHREMYQADYDPTKMGGHYRQAYVGFSSRPDVRKEGASGGVVTQMLIHLLREGMIDGAIVIGSSPDDPTIPMPFIARTEAEILEAAQSKYSVVANTKVLRDLRKTKERFAFVGVACQIHGLRKLQKLNKRMAERCVITIGLACRGTLERQATRDLLQVQGVNLEQVQKLEYRGGPFPGKFRARYKDGSIQELSPFEFKDGAFLNLMRLYMPPRCHLCPDYSAEFADISCSDIFLGGKDGDYRYKQGTTVVVCRTEKGEQILKGMVEKGALYLDPIQPETLEMSYSHVRRHRKAIPFLRIQDLRRAGRPAPEYGIEVKSRFSDRIYDLFYRATYFFTPFPRLKILILRFLYSPLGTALIGLKVSVKKVRRGLKARKAWSRGA
ncbi:MAG: 4Fe-4S dicluster domain-containing protein [Chloroflexi bacterium]|nr:4Fe-4S dicluster domain-containing protein [Chloroflexota bacterium]